MICSRILLVSLVLLYFNRCQTSGSTKGSTSDKLNSLNGIIRRRRMTSLLETFADAATHRTSIPDECFISQMVKLTTQGYEPKYIGVLRDGKTSYSVDFMDANLLPVDSEMIVTISNIAPGAVLQFDGVRSTSRTILKRVSMTDQLSCGTTTLTAADLSLLDYFATGMIKLIVPDGSSAQNVSMARL